MAIQKDPSKAPVPSCGVHSLTCYVMNYISFLADYSGAFVDIVVYWLLNLQTPLPESYFGSPSELNDSPVSIRFAWRIVCHGSPPHQRDSSLPLSLSLSLSLTCSLSFHFPSLSLKNFYLFQGQLLLKFLESFELEMTFLCICCTIWLPRKWEKIEKKRKYFFIWIFNIIADVDVLMWNFLIPRMEKCYGFHFNIILVILIIG